MCSKVVVCRVQLLCLHDWDVHHYVAMQLVPAVVSMQHTVLDTMCICLTVVLREYIQVCGEAAQAAEADRGRALCQLQL